MKKIFVLDTSVILFNHNSLLSFAEHDVVIPITVLEELDNFKKGNETKNFEAREFIRLLDKISIDKDITQWMALPGENKGNFKIVLNTDGLKSNANELFNNISMDNKIINAALKMKEEEPKKPVILVTKDINLRLKAKAVGLNAEDFETGKVQDTESFSAGIQHVDNFNQDIIERLYNEHHVPLEDVEEFLEIKPNQYYILKGSNSSVLAYYNPFEKQLEQVSKQRCYGIQPRNAEQTFAMHAILNPNIKLVAIHGVAGTGKTLIALAAALEQRRNFKQIYLARPIVPLSNKDIGYLPGDIKSKIDPYMQPLWDNLKFIQYQYNESDPEYKHITQMLESEKLMITPLAYIRGRSLSDVIFIVDEAQNLTPHEIKTIITRAGENSKFIFTGDIKQIDTPYLDELSNGLSYMVDRIQGEDIFSHIQLVKGERSELANLANERL
ncbi:PhoH family protein [Weeksellaceae bacterium KMM 9713]|uniref:PhoH family protein n=1 Tax=Profundicola chukchiensis TaxID=2961959 RepID=A0A9X4RTX0_9FLAO|nr:PhoH family protein [Profundicola chukchiensis]MDG4945076.1 PhoH family protein [Profundicola chukchiensis]